MRQNVISYLFMMYCMTMSSFILAVPSTEQNYTADLIRQLPADEVVALNIDEQQTFMSLQRDTLTSYTKGTAILLPDGNEHAASPKHIDLLRQQLNSYGWYTLAIMPPTLPAELNEKNLDSYQQALLQRLKAAQKQAQQHSGVTIIIAQGTSAALLNQLFSTNQLAEPAAFIMLGAFLPDATLNRNIAKALATHQVPTLDISSQQDNVMVTSQLTLRRQLANKHLKALYRQRLVNGSGYNADAQQWVFQEIYGWLGSVGL